MSRLMQWVDRNPLLFAVAVFVALIGAAVVTLSKLYDSSLKDYR